MKKILASILGVASATANAGVVINHDEFVFKLDGDWRQAQSSDPDQFSFESSSKRTTVVMSVVGPLNVPAERLVEVATKF